MSPGRTVKNWLRGVDLNHRPLGYEPNELPDCSTPQSDHSNRTERRQTERVLGQFPFPQGER